jgi:flagellar motility protein MotE (MotC chaperone)
MKAVLAFFGLCAVLGVVYALALFGVIPVQKMAAKSPAMAKVLIALHLGGPKHPKLTAKAAPESPEQQMLDAEKTQLDAQQAQLTKDKAAFEAQQQQALATQNTAPATPQTDTDAKLIAVYATMDPDDLARIFAKLPDPQVIDAIVQLDERKGGAVLATLPPDRAARISEAMAAHPHPRHAAVAAAPATAL